jgi:hypothetical protein
MWGVKLHQHRELVEGLTRAMIMAGQNEEKYTDQTLLDKIVWPSAQYDVVRVGYTFLYAAHIGQYTQCNQSLEINM